MSSCGPGTLKTLNYRVDMVTSSKASESLTNHTTSIIELSLDNNKNSSDNKVARFEVQKEEMDEILGEFNKIQKVIDKARGGGNAKPESS